MSVQERRDCADIAINAIAAATVSRLLTVQVRADGPRRRCGIGQRSNSADQERLPTGFRRGAWRRGKPGRPVRVLANRPRNGDFVAFPEERASERTTAHYYAHARTAVGRDYCLPAVVARSPQ